MKMFSGPTCSPNLDIGAVERADGQRAVQRQLHVAGARRLHPGGRDLLRQVGGRDDRFREAYIVVRQENHLQPVADHRIGVDHLRHIVRELDDELRPIVARAPPCRQKSSPAASSSGSGSARIAW